jgi:hypothetical protein
VQIQNDLLFEFIILTLGFILGLRHHKVRDGGCHGLNKIIMEILNKIFQIHLYAIS